MWYKVKFNSIEPIYERYTKDEDIIGFTQCWNPTSELLTTSQNSLLENAPFWNLTEIKWSWVIPNDLQTCMWSVKLLCFTNSRGICNKEQTPLLASKIVD